MTSLTTVHNLAFVYFPRRPLQDPLRTFMEDKYIGLLLAVSASVAIGSSFIITKKVCMVADHSIEQISNAVCAGFE